MKAPVTRIYLTLLVFTFIFQASDGNISLPEIFSDNMVLQQKSDVTIWGWAKTGEKVVLKADWLTANMEWSAAMGINNAEEEIKNANYPDIRFFSVYHATSHYPQDHFTGEWTACTSESMPNFSVLAYLYARKLHEALGVPIGVINSS